MPENRYLIAIGNPKSIGANFLPEVGTDIEKITTFFTSTFQGYKRVLQHEIPLGADSYTVKRYLSEWFASEERSKSDRVIVYISGHGDIDWSRFRSPALLFSNSKPNNPQTIIKPQELVSIFFDGENDRPENLLLFLDCCFAGKLADSGIVAALNNDANNLAGGEGFCVIASSPANSRSIDGAFANAFLDIALNDAWLPVGEYYTVAKLAENINGWFEEKNNPQRAVWNVVNAKIDNRFISVQRLPAPAFVVESDDFPHWDIKARGVDYSSMAGWFFTGREKALQELNTYLVEPDKSFKAVIVTGDPGSGKSAILGRLVLSSTSSASSHPEGKYEPFAGSDYIRISINSRGASVDTLIQALGKQIGTVFGNLNDVFTHIGSLDGTVGIVIDSLDEAMNPKSLLTQIIYPLSNFSNVRMIIGSRRYVIDKEIYINYKFLDLDDPAYKSSEAIRDYVISRLSQKLTGKLMDDEIDKIASLISNKAVHSFLYARMITMQLAEQFAGVNFNLEAWKNSYVLPANISEAFFNDLARFGPETSRKYIDLLIPLAYAKGKGLPFKSIWPRVASQIADYKYSMSDIRQLKEAAGYYLIRDIENDEYVYRLFHQSFADYLIASTKDEDIERKFGTAIKALRGKNDKGLHSWENTSEPYLVKYFAIHLVAANIIDTELTDKDFLLNYPPQYLLPQLPFVKSPEARLIAKAYRRSVHWLESSKQAFIAYLFWQSYEYDVSIIKSLLKPLKNTLPWYPQWALWENQLSNYAVAQTAENIYLCQSYEDEVLGPIAICIYSDGVVRIWQLNDGKLFRTMKMSRLDDEKSEIRSVHAKFLDVERVNEELFIVVLWSEGTLALFEAEQELELKCTVVSEVIDSFKLVKLGNKLTLYFTTTAFSKRPPAIIALNIPSLEIFKVREHAAGAAIYSIQYLLVDGKPLIVTAGDSMRNGQTEETELLKLWDENLEQVGGWSSDNLYVLKNLHPFYINNEWWMFVFVGFGAYDIIRLSDFKRLRLPTGYVNIVDELAGFRIKNNTIEIVSKNFNIINTHQIDFNQDPPEIANHWLNVPIDQSNWLTPLTINKHFSLINKSLNKLRIWNFEEIMELSAVQNKPATKAFQFGLNERFRQVLISEGLIYLLTNQSNLLVLEKDGKILSINQTELNIFNIYGSLNNKRMINIVGRTLNIINPLNFITESTISLGTEVEEALAVQIIDGDKHPLALVIVKTHDYQHTYGCEIWDIGLQRKVFTGHDKLRIAGYSDKKIYQSRWLKYQDHSLIIIAGPNGRARFYEWKDDYFETLFDFDMHSYNNYIYEIDCCEYNRKLYCILGDETGAIALVNITDQSLASQIKGESWEIQALKFYQTNNNLIIISGTKDGKICFRNDNLELIYTIEIEHPIIDLIMLDDNSILITCEYGISKMHLDWAAILANPKQSHL